LSTSLSNQANDWKKLVLFDL